VSAAITNATGIPAVSQRAGLSVPDFGGCSSRVDQRVPAWRAILEAGRSAPVADNDGRRDRRSCGRSRSGFALALRCSRPGRGRPEGLIRW
jgi:hypothetical protein